MQITFEELYDAYRRCRANKAATFNALRFEYRLIDNLWSLLEELRTWRYRPGSYLCFAVHTPKPREVFASDFRDRVVHHLLVHDLEPLFEPIFIYDSYSCRKEKGTHRAVRRMQRFMRRPAMRWYLQLDVRNFFLSIDKQILFERIREVVERRASEHARRTLFLSEQIIFDEPAKHFRYRGDFSRHDSLPRHKSLLYTPEGKGLPIGNLTSQFFANVYLDPLDNFVKRTLKVKNYVRYVDDFVLLGSDPQQLLEQKTQIEHFLAERLKLSLRPTYRLRRCSDGLDFLGYVIRPDYTLVRNRAVGNFKAARRLFLARCFDESGTCSGEDAKWFKTLNASYYGHFKHASARGLIDKYDMELWRNN